MTRDETDKLIGRLGADRVVETLAAYLTDRRKDRIEVVLAGRNRGVHVAVEEPYDPHNAAAVVRSAEALGAGAVHAINAHERALSAKRTTQGAYHWVEHRRYPDLTSFTDRMAERGVLLAGASGDGVRRLDEVPVVGPLCLLFGNEHRGLSAQARAACAFTFRIPTFGFSESLNLSVAAAISLYDVLSRRRIALGRASDLSDEESRTERARCYIRSVDPRLVDGLLCPSAAPSDQAPDPAR